MNDPYIRMMFGENAVHLPINIINQPDHKGGHTFGVFQMKHPAFEQLSFGGKKTHQLILGDMVIRSRIVLDSDHLQGVGLAGLATQGFDLPGWVENGNILIKH